MTRVQKLNAALAIGGLLVGGFFFKEYRNIPDQFFADPLGPLFLPLILIIGLMVISVLIFIQAIRPGSVYTSRTEPDEDDNEPTSRPVQVALLLIAGALYTFAMPYVGYYAVSFGFALLILFMGRPDKPLRNVLAAVALTVIFYLLFGVGLKVPFPKPELFM